MADIDYFKKINDTYGHNTGDRILKTFGQVLSRNVRDGDKVFRWGGEEFVIIVHTSSERARVMAEKIRHRVQDNVYCENIHLTCSMGVTAMDAASSLTEQIDRADQALYEAKRAGRNRVRVAEA